jgi:hypothetical protein
MAIVNINVSVTNPPKPSQLLKSGAMISMGGTTLAAGEYQLLTTKDDLKAIPHRQNYFNDRLGNRRGYGDPLSSAWLDSWRHYPAGCLWRYPAAYNRAVTATVTTLPPSLIRWRQTLARQQLWVR